MTAPPILELAGITAGYERAVVLDGIDLVVPQGSVTAVLGPNGAGKTTLLRTAAGLLSPSRGSVALAGTDVTRWRPSRRARAGVCLIPEGRGIFPRLTVRENLRLQGASQGGDGWEAALAAFPSLRDRLDQRAGTMSGGQQQMVALCRAWIAEPSVILLDEVSMGLAPKVVDEIFSALTSLARTGVSLVLVEQYVDRALAVADRVHLLVQGQVRASGVATGFDRDELMRGYLGEDRGTDRQATAEGKEPGDARLDR